jgi:predicted Zn-dependent peptidase
MAAGRGTIESVSSITAADIKDYTRWCWPRHAQDRHCGDIDAASAGKLIDKVFGSLRSRAVSSPSRWRVRLGST